MWGVQGPPKLRPFLWRACKGSLPVNAVRYRRHMNDSDMCTRCDEVSESICHALLDCAESLICGLRLLSTLWFMMLSECLLILYSYGFIPTQRWMNCHWFCSSLWACWMGHNKSVLKNTRCNLIQLFLSLNKMMVDYKSYAQKVYTNLIPRVPSSHSWQPPDSGWIKVNFWRTYKSWLQKGIGYRRILCRDAQGTVLLTGTRSCRADWSIEASKAMTALYGLEVARRMGFSKVHLEEDALNVVSAIANAEIGRASDLSCIW